MGALSRRAIRVGAAGVCIALATVGAPGHADAEPVLSFEVSESLAIATGEQMLVEGVFRLTPSPPVATLRDVAVVIDVSELDGVGEVTASSGNQPCAVEGHTVVCFGDDDNFDIHDGRLEIPLFYLRGIPGAQPGTNVSLPITVTTGNFPDVSGVTRLTKAGEVKLRNGEQHTITGRPGDTRGVPVSVTNTSDVPVDGAVLMLVVPWQVRMERRFRNCGYHDQLAVCRLESQLAPHTTYALTGELWFTIRDYAVAPSETTGYLSWSPRQTFDTRLAPTLPRLTQGTGPRLGVTNVTPLGRAPEPDTRSRNDPGVYDIRITNDNPVDFAAVGATVSGGVGETRELRVGLRNAGHAFAEHPDSHKPRAYVDIRLPKGLSLLSDAPCGRLPQQGGYRCELVRDSMPGDRHLWTFPVRIDRQIPAASGSVTVVDGAVQDGRSGNDTARIVIDPTAAASPSPTPSATPTGSPSATPTASPSGTPGPGTMPVTGNRLSLLLAISLASVVAGGLLYRNARRRRA